LAGSLVSLEIEAMTAKPHSTNAPNAVQDQDVANLGFIRPPLVYLISLATKLLPAAAFG
jgi:hypothetical protein